MGCELCEEISLFPPLLVFLTVADVGDALGSRAEMQRSVFPLLTVRGSKECDYC